MMALVVDFFINLVLRLVFVVANAAMLALLKKLYIGCCTPKPVCQSHSRWHITQSVPPPVDISCVHVQLDDR